MSRRNGSELARERKLIIQIPCFNERETLPATLADLPREVPGFDRVEWLVIDDGSIDGTAEVAREHGVDHVVRHDANRGLARAFMTGVDACLRLGADVIVNTDADNQYDASFIPDLVAPVADGRADLVVGTRPIAGIAHFSPIKKALQLVGSRVVRLASGARIEDAPSGFRAFNREAATRMAVLGRYTYTVETLFHLSAAGLRIECVPVDVNADLRPSRLVRSIPSYVLRMARTILRLWVSLHGQTMLWGGAAAALLAWLIGLSEVVAPMLAGILSVGGVLAERAAINRQLLEDIRRQLRAERLGS